MSKRKTKSKAVTAPFPRFLTDLSELQADSATAWPFDLELTSDWASAEETSDMLASWTGAEEPAAGDCWLRVFGSDGAGGAFGMFQHEQNDIVVFLGSEGELGVFGSLQTFALLIAKGVEPNSMAVNMDEGAAEGHEHDADDLAFVMDDDDDDDDDDSGDKRGKQDTIVAIAKLVKKHFKVNAESVPVADVLKQMDQPLPLQQFCKFVLSKTAHKRD
jgi:hypothetical protein